MRRLFWCILYIIHPLMNNPTLLVDELAEVRNPLTSRYPFVNMKEMLKDV